MQEAEKRHISLSLIHISSVLFWSLGNESYAGDNIEAMNQYFKDKKDGRLVHYESSYYNRAYEDTISDIESRMYAKTADVEEYLINSAKKPYILCEFMHDMGNSMGGLGSYMELIDKYEMYQGDVYKRQGESAVGFRSFRCKSFHAGYDGYHLKPGSE